MNLYVKFHDQILPNDDNQINITAEEQIIIKNKKIRHKKLHFKEEQKKFSQHF
jgi:hypothetical protein